jgi:hypothetical protein
MKPAGEVSNAVRKSRPHHCGQPSHDRLPRIFPGDGSHQAPGLRVGVLEFSVRLRGRNEPSEIPLVGAQLSGHCGAAVESIPTRLVVGADVPGNTNGPLRNGPPAATGFVAPRTLARRSAIAARSRSSQFRDALTRPGVPQNRLVPRGEVRSWSPRPSLYTSRVPRTALQGRRVLLTSSATRGARTALGS